MGSRLDSTSSTVRKRIEDHRFEGEEGDEYESSKFGGFTDYFRRKKIKLQNRDFERRAAATDRPKIFKGVVAHVNGYTQPSLNDLHDLIVDYGGGFMQYLDGKTTATHIIASNLTPKKKIEFRRYRIVKPAWVVDSVAAGRLLPWEKYAVVDEGGNQQVLNLESGSVKSQANTQSTRYREQTDTSWYTSQLRDFAERLNADDPENSQRETLSAYQVDEQEQHQGLGPQASNVNTSKQDDLSDRADHDSDDYATPDAHEGEIYTAQASASTPRRTEALPQQAVFSPDDVPDSEIRSGVTLAAADTKHSHNADFSPKKSAMTAEEHNAKLLADPKVWKSTVVNPAFLKQYYEESRLHHLSHWKAELKSQMQALALEKSSSQKSRQKQPAGSRRYILHVDFDCFFAAVSLRKHPEFIDKPTVVAHGGGTGSEIASCNYPARAFGVKNGMWMKTAQQLCADLKVLPYNFKAYEEASRHFYEVILDIDGVVQSVSIDEALIDISTLCIDAGGHEGRGVQEGSIWREQEKAEELAQSIRDRIKERTGCAVSVGIGGNILLAKVALRKAKPMGQYHVKPEMMLDFLGELNVQDLPGVAYSIGGKLEEIGVKFVKDIRSLTKEKLSTTLGPKTGEKIWDYSRGIDRTEVGEQVIRKSVSAEVNWGVRFATQEQADEFVHSLCEELHKRLVTERVKGRQLTMKLMRRSADSPLDPPKHLGHGKCDTFNKSVVLGVSTNMTEVLSHEAISIMRGWNFPPGELRGIGVQMTKLEPLKGSAESPVDSSQRRLQFNVPLKVKEAKQKDDIIDDIRTPPKLRRSGSSSFQTASISARPQTDEPSEQNLLNTLGTQFVLPTQVDPHVLSELPNDIRAKLFPMRTNPPAEPEPPRFPVEQTKTKPAIPTTTDSAFPSLSQLDQDTLDALPPDVRAEVIASYQQSPPKSRNQTVLLQSPRKDRMLRPPKKKLLTPTKKRVGLLGRGRPSSKNSNAASTLTQANFVTGNIKRNKNGNSRDNAPPLEDVSPEFLAALPEDIRKEILDQQRRERLRRQGGIDIFSKSRFDRPGTTNRKLPPAFNRTFKPRPPRPTFTAQKLSGLPDLREAASAWYEEFKDEGPYEEDTAALVAYLQKVVKEEKDMTKATAVVKWLGWLVEQEGAEREVWQRALKQIGEGVQGAVKERGLGKVVLD